MGLITVDDVVVAEHVRVHALPGFVDERGELVAAAIGDGLPFRPARFFVIRDVPAGAVRGAHAWRRGTELLACLRGACTIETWWEGGHDLRRLTEPSMALEVAANTWIECRDFTGDALLLVMCSHVYDPAHLIDDPREFEAGLGSHR